MIQRFLKTYLAVCFAFILPNLYSAADNDIFESSSESSSESSYKITENYYIQEEGKTQKTKITTYDEAVSNIEELYFFPIKEGLEKDRTIVFRRNSIQRLSGLAEWNSMMQNAIKNFRTLSESRFETWDVSSVNIYKEENETAPITSAMICTSFEELAKSKKHIYARSSLLFENTWNQFFFQNDDERKEFKNWKPIIEPVLRDFVTLVYNKELYKSLYYHYRHPSPYGMHILIDQSEENKLKARLFFMTTQDMESTKEIYNIKENSKQAKYILLEKSFLSDLFLMDVKANKNSLKDFKDNHLQGLLNDAMKLFDELLAEQKPSSAINSKYYVGCFLICSIGIPVSLWVYSNNKRASEKSRIIKRRKTH